MKNLVFRVNRINRLICEHFPIAMMVKLTKTSQRHYPNTFILFLAQFCKHDFLIFDGKLILSPSELMSSAKITGSERIKSIA